MVFRNHHWDPVSLCGWAVRGFRLLLLQADEGKDDGGAHWPGLDPEEHEEHHREHRVQLCVQVTLCVYRFVFRCVYRWQYFCTGVKVCVQVTLCVYRWHYVCTGDILCVQVFRWHDDTMKYIAGNNQTNNSAGSQCFWTCSGQEWRKRDEKEGHWIEACVPVSALSS